MKAKNKIILLLLILFGCAIAAYFVFAGSGDEAKIRRTLEKMTQLAAKPQEPKPAELAMKLRILQTVFAEQVSIEFSAHRFAENYTPRSLEPMLVNFRKHFASSDSSMSDLEINLSGSRADAVFSCRFQAVNRKKERVDEVYDVHCQLVKREQTWYIERVSINEILER